MRFLNEVNELIKERNNSVFSTKIVVLTLVFILSAISINAQIEKPINSKIDLNKIKPNQRPDLTIKQGGFSGFVFNNSNHKEKIGGVKIIFENKAGGLRKEVVTDKYGHFKIALKMGKYLVYGIKSGYIPYVTHPGTQNVSTGFKTYNIFLDKE